MRSVALIVMLCGVVLHAQPPRDGAVATAQAFTVTGRVLTERGDPIPNARVGLTPQNQGTPVVLSDDRGRFALNVPTGPYRVVASKTGYAKRDVAAYASAPLEIRLTRSAAISGRVLDDCGEPVPGVRIAAESADTTKTAAPLATTTTDERGEYRLTGLAPGIIVVSAAPINPPRSGTIEVSIPIEVVQQMRNPTDRFNASRVYYPGGTALAAAEGLRLEAGDERSRIDFTLSGQQAVQLPAQIGALMAASERAGIEAAAAANRTANASAAAVPPPANASIRGRVVSTDGRAVPFAQVIVRPRTGRSMNRVIKSDADGGFEVTDLRPGPYRVVAAKPGFSSVALGSNATTDAGGFAPSFDLADGETRDRVEVRLAPWRALEGRVLDELGDPIEGASVVVFQSRYQDGRRRLVEVGGSRLTNDLGQYRVSNLAPGRYIVSAAVGAVMSADIPGYARSYFPGVSIASEAQFVTLGTAQDMVGIDIALSRVPTARLSGTLLNAAGEPVGGGINLVPSRGASAIGTTVGARILSDGLFEFPNVAPGQYVIQAYRGRANGFTEGEFAAVPVAVSGSDVNDLVVQTVGGSSVTGRITFDTYGASSPPPPGRFELASIPVDSDLSPGDTSANIRADWTFEIRGVHGPRRLQLTRTPPGWALEAIRVNGADVADRPLPFGTSAQSLDDVEVVLTDRVGALSIAVTDGSWPAAWALVIVFSTDRDRWYPASRFFRRASAGADGTATVAALPAGGYYAAAIAALPADGPDALQDPAFLESLVPRATTVILGEVEQRTISLRLPVR